MASQWQTQVSQKLFLAKTLLAIQEASEHQAEREASNQGAIELTLRARKLLLAMIADFYQHKNQAPRDLDELVVLLGPELPEIIELESLARQSGSWWQQLEQLEWMQSRPPAKQKTISDENIIAVSVASGPDRTATTLTGLVTALKRFTDSVAERHNEW